MTQESEKAGRSGEFTIVVMGKSTEFPIQEHAELAKPSKDALERTHNNPDLSKWVLKSSQGMELSFADTERQAGVKDRDVLYLSPKIGAGGV